jgi:hypothetical protein
MIYLLFAFIAGFLTKVADDYSERKKKSLFFSIPLGLLYGAAIGISGLLNTKLISQIGGIVVGNTLAFKIDRLEHFIAVGVVLALALYAGYNGATVDVAILIAFIIAAFADEKLHDMGEKAASNKKMILEARLITPITALTFAFFEISYLLYIVAFDIGYHLAEHAGKTTRAR